MESRTVNINDTVVPADPHDDTVYTVVAVEPGNHQDRLVTLSYGDGQIGYVYIWSIRYYGWWYLDDPLMDEEDIATRYEEVTERD